MTTRLWGSPQQIVRVLDQADRLLLNGRDLPRACREQVISKSSYYWWR